MEDKEVLARVLDLREKFLKMLSLDDDSLEKFLNSLPEDDFAILHAVTLMLELKESMISQGMSVEESETQIKKLVQG